MQINRLFEMVYILLNKKQVTAKELSERFEVSTRTIYRDIECLCQAGVPIYTNKGKGGGISMLDNFVLNKSYLSAKEQQEVVAALQGLRATPFTGQNEVLGKLSALFGTEEEEWIEVDFGSWDQEEKEKFDQIKTAIFEKKVLSFEYYNAKMEKLIRQVEPMRLCFKEKSWYLKGYCRVKQGIRLFKLRRMRNVEVLEERFESKLNLLEVEQGHQKQKVYRIPQGVKVWVDKSQAYRVYDEFDEKDIIKDPEGNFIVETHFPEDEWLYSYFLSYGASAKILEPESIREKIKKRLSDACRLYEIPGKGI